MNEVISIKVTIMSSLNIPYNFTFIHYDYFKYIKNKLLPQQETNILFYRY